MQNNFKMGSQKRTQIVVLLAALFLVVLLIVAPRIPKSAQLLAEAEKSRSEDPVQQRISEAVAMVQSGESPMQGVMKLREILEEYPDHLDVHWHLGHFSVQSGQYEKAIERFQKVVELDDHGHYPDANFYLGKTYATLNEKERAIDSFEQYLEVVQDTTIKKRVEEFIDELKN